MGDADANPQQVPEAQPESDDSGFSEEDTNDFDNAFGDALDGEDIEGDTVGDVDAPLLRAAGQHTELEPHATDDSIPINKFAKSFEQVALSHGDNLSHVDADGKLKTRAGKTHPNTRNCVNMLRTGMLRHPPRRELMQGHSDFEYAVTLLKTTAAKISREQVLEDFRILRETGLTPAGTTVAMLGKRNDETEFPIRFSDKESKAWIAWQMALVNRERYLTKDDIAKISEVMEANRVGTAHVLSQHVRLRYGSGSNQPSVRDVVTPACTVQRTSASNLRVATDALPFEELTYRYWKVHVAAFLDFSLIFIGADEGPAPQRCMRETCELFRDSHNVAVFGSFCRGHVVGGGSGEALDQEGVLTFIARLSHVLRSHDNHKIWLASQAVQSAARIGNRIIRATEGQHADEINYSDQFWDRLGKSTIFREAATSARSHPLDPKNNLSDEEKQEEAEVQRIIKELEECLAELKILVQIAEKDFRKGKHICLISRCGSYCSKQTWCLRFNKVWSKLMSHICPARGLKIAKTRFLTWMSMLAMGMLSIMCVSLGPEAWLDKWSVKASKNEMDNNERAAQIRPDEDSKSRAEVSKRKHTVSQGWACDMNLAMFCGGNCVIEPVGAFYRYLDRADALSNRGKYPPLILQLVQPVANRNPMKIYFAEVGKFFSPDSQINWVLQVWAEAVEVPIFSIQFAFRTLRMTLRIHGKLLLKISLEIECQCRFKVWELVPCQYFDGVTSLAAIRSSQSIEEFADCCVDRPFSMKILGTPPKRGIDLCLSKPIEACRDFSPDVAQMNLDEERLLSMLRQISWGDNAMSMQIISDAAYCRTVREHHERLGGTTNTGAVTSKELQTYDLDVLECRGAVKAQHGATGKMKAWTMFFRDRIAPEWQQAQAATETVQSRVSEASEQGQSKRASASKMFREKQDAASESAKPVWVKGQGDWLTWLQFFRQMTSKYNSDPLLQAAFARKALEFNAANPGAAVELAPEMQVLGEADTFFQMGSAGCPIRPSLIEEEVVIRSPEVEASHPTAKRVPGPIRVARAIQAERDGKLFFSDTRLPGPLPKLEHETHICWYHWPGLCQKRDKAVFETVLRITMNLNTIASFKCEGNGRSEYDMIGRVLRFYFLLSSED